MPRSLHAPAVLRSTLGLTGRQGEHRGQDPFYERCREVGRCSEVEYAFHARGVEGELLQATSMRPERVEQGDQSLANPFERLLSAFVEQTHLHPLIVAAGPERYPLVAAWNALVVGIAANVDSEVPWQLANDPGAIVRLDANENPLYLADDASTAFGRVGNLIGQAQPRSEAGKVAARQGAAGFASRKTKERSCKHQEAEREQVRPRKVRHCAGIPCADFMVRHPPLVDTGSLAFFFVRHW